MLESYKHHSASTLNGFIENKFTFYLKKIRGIKFPGNPNMHRGSSVEAGINHWMTDDKGDVQEAIRVANEYFKEKTTGMLVMPDMRASIALCVNEGISSVIKNYGTDKCKQQEKIEFKLEGVELPIVGYLDWHYVDKKLVVDNKVTSKSPSQLTQGYIIQGSTYKKATGHDVQFHYIVPLAKEVKTKILKLEEKDFNYGIRLLTMAAKAVEKIMKMELTFEEINALWFPDVSNSWSADEQRIILTEMGM